MTAIQGTGDYSQRSLVNGQLPAGTYHFEFGGDSSLVHGTHMQWDATLVAVATIWVCGFPPPGSPGGTPSNNATAGDWIQLQSTTGYVPFSPAGSCTIVNQTITIPGGGGGGGAGGCYVDLGNFSAPRVKVQLVVTTPGFFRGRGNGKD